MIKLYKEWVESKRLANLQAKITIVQDLSRLSFMSKRFVLTEYLLTPEQLERNDDLWAEENGTSDEEITDLETALEELKEEFDRAHGIFDDGVTE
jgi:hypothetical protein